MVKNKKQQQKTPASENLPWKRHASVINKVIWSVNKTVSSGKEKVLEMNGSDHCTTV